MRNQSTAAGALPWDRDTVETRYALRVTALLSQQADGLPHDISERLRVARSRAAESGRWAQQAQAKTANATVVTGGRNSLSLGGDGGWGWRFASVLPVVALVVGLLFIQDQSDSDEIHAAADIDAALLSDTLPPDAYADVGFAEFLRRQEP